MTRTAALFLLIALAACSKSGVHETNASVAEVSNSLHAQAGRRGFIQPGEWLSSVIVDDVAMPGLTAAAEDSMKRALAQSRGGKSCLTPEQVSEPAPPFFAGSEQCRYNHFTMAHGKIDAEMTCGAHGVSETTVMTGRYSPNAYSIAMQTSTDDAGPGRGMTVTMHVDARRLGPCAPKNR